jgi:metallophosphoesterase (TIGR00282 family)
VKLLFVGDIVGKPGRQMLARGLDRLIDRHQIDFVVANGENAAGGFGLTADVLRELFSIGVNVVTTGNHVWDKREICDVLEVERALLRPANYPEGSPGRGQGVYETPGGVKVGVINLEGRVFMSNLDCPFAAADRLVDELSPQVDVLLVDFHAEATSEKTALCWHLDGRVSAIAGTHTHVQTADERILPGGTATITDVGMTGSWDSVIGMDQEAVVRKFITQMPSRFEVAKKNPILCAVVFDIDESSGRARTVERIMERSN